MAQVGGRFKPRTPEYRHATHPHVSHKQTHRAPVPSSIFGPPKAPTLRPAQRQATARERAAANRLPAVLPKIPKLGRYTAAQRRVINHLMAHSVNANRLPGESAQQALERLAHHPNLQIRQAVGIFRHTSRQEYHHQRRLAYKRSVRQLKSLGLAEGEARRIAQAGLRGAFVPHGVARPRIEPERHGLPIGEVIGAINAPLAAVGARFGQQLHSVGATGIGGRALRDLVNAPANVIPGAWALTDATANAALGHTKQIQDIYRSAKQTDPIVHAVTTGDIKGAIRLASEHPGLTALELYGGAGAADRLLGIASRLERVGARVSLRAPGYRTPRGVPNTNLFSPRRYSKGYVVSRLQKRADRVDAERYSREMDAARRETYMADRATATGDHAAAVTHHAAAERHLERARSVDPTLVQERALLHPFRQSDIRRRADEQEALGQGRRRPNRSAVQREFAGKRALRESKRQPDVLGKGSESEVQGLIAQGIVAPSREALGRYAQKLLEIRPHLAESRLAANRRLVAAIQDFLATGRDPAELVPRALEFTKRQRAKEREAVQARAADPEELRMARLKAYAANNIPGVHVDEHGRLAVRIDAREPKHVRAARERAIEQAQRRVKANEDAQTAAAEAYAAERYHVQQGQALRRSLLDTEIKRGGGHLSGEVERRLAEANARLREKEARLEEATNALKAARRDLQRVSFHVPPRVTKVLTAQDIERHLNANPEFAKHGITSQTIGFVSHAPRSTDSAFNIRFFRRGGTPPGLSTRHRTGRAVVEGTASHGREAMLSGPVRLQGIIDGIRSYQRAISEAAVRDKKGRIVTASSRKRAEALRDNLMLDKHGHPLPGAVKLRIVRLNPLGGREEQLRGLLDKVDQEGFAVDANGTRTHPVLDAIDEALKGKGDGPYALVPDEYADQLERHAEVYRSTSPAWRALTNLFRHTVLPFSPSWLQGNVTEAALRAAIVGAGPRSYLTFRRVVSALAQADPQQLEELLNRIGTGHLGTVDRVAVRVTAAQFADSPFRGVVQAWEKARERPTPRAIGNALGAYTHWMLSTVNGQLEAQFKHAMAGKYIRENFMDGAGPKLASRAVQQAMEGLRGTPAQVELARWVTRAYGQYEGFSPRMRQIIINYTPFLAWSRNAVQFVASVLPKDHPALTALLAANDNATRQWRRAHAQDAGFSSTPSWLLQSVPAPRWYAKLTGTPAGAPVRLGRYTPFGFWSDPLGTTASTALPQVSGVYHAFEGQNPFGDKLHGTSRGVQAIKEALFATVPLTSQIARAVGKKGSVPARIRQVLNPLEPSHSTAAGYSPAAGGGKLPKGYDPNKIDWRKVDWGAADGGQIDWSKVNWKAAK